MFSDDTVHAGHFASFGQGEMCGIIDEYLAGGRRIGDVGDWVGSEMTD